MLLQPQMEAPRFDPGDSLELKITASSRIWAIVREVQLQRSSVCSCKAEQVLQQARAGLSSAALPHAQTYHTNAFKSKDCSAKEQRVGLPGCCQGQVSGIRNVLEKSPCRVQTQGGWGRPGLLPSLPVNSPMVQGKPCRAEGTTMPTGTRSTPQHPNTPLLSSLHLPKHGTAQK